MAKEYRPILTEQDHQLFMMLIDLSLKSQGAKVLGPMAHLHYKLSTCEVVDVPDNPAVAVQGEAPLIAPKATLKPVPTRRKK